jgi:Tfp pilus assembly protein PilN
MSLLLWPLIVWGIVTSLLVILLIYRGTLTMQEDDQLYLSESNSQMQQAQAEILQKVQKIGPFVKALGALSGVLILAIGGIALYQQLSQTGVQ